MIRHVCILIRASMRHAKKPFIWTNVKWVLVLRGIAAALLTYFMGFSVAWGQVASTSGGPAVSSTGGFYTNTTTDPWFWAMWASWLFSSIVSGMPEPEKTDGKGYIWMYRSLHIITATGTSYFQHRNLWPDFKAVTVTDVHVKSQVEGKRD